LTPRAVVGALVGVAACALLMTRLDDAAFAATQSFLVVVGALLLLAVALAVPLRPLRLALFRAFGVPHAVHGPSTASPEEVRAMLPAIFAALACLAVAGLGALLR
jgi:hypothetical protein